MKSKFTFALIALIMAGVSAQAQGKKDLKEEFQTLGDNQEVVERVRLLDNRQRVRVVQNRLVDRNNRIELSLNIGALSGGDSYVNTTQTGVNLQYHLNPHWSFGVEYQKASNQLTDEGKRVYDRVSVAQANDPESPERFPQVDFPIDTKMATISFYPIYGKLNLFDWSIAQFDLYTLFGYGSKKMNSGETNTMVAGLGSGIWINNYVTARLEVRYEKYKDLLQSVQRDQNAVTGMASIGIMVW